MKGRTSQPLLIGVDRSLMEQPEIQALIAQGHEIRELVFEGYALILAPQAHQMNKALLAYLPAAITAARRKKREGRK